ncbi:MGMT family protein [Endozoicomonas sp.]|uniref:MGMT family protein n=1 Tax=Endozoicomonas sp. TaxID=1892382 RepID=UPI003AF913FA
MSPDSTSPLFIQTVSAHVVLIEKNRHNIPSTLNKQRKLLWSNIERTSPGQVLSTCKIHKCDRIHNIESQINGNYSYIFSFPIPYFSNILKSIVYDRFYRGERTLTAPFTPSEIWYLLSRIPKGCVVTYGQLAEMAGAPGYARVVGNILKQLPAGTDLPWHRVINGKGQISFPDGSSRYNLQKLRLEQEGVAISSGKINLKAHQWHGE